MGAVSRVLAVAVPHEMGEIVEWGLWGGGSCLLPLTQASPASCIDALHGLVAMRGLFRCGSRVPHDLLLLVAMSLAGLSRAFVPQVELNAKTFGDLNYYL